MRWARAAALFVTLQLFVAAAVAMAVGFYEPPPVSKYLQTAAFPLLGYIAVFSLWNLRSKPDRPAKHLLSLDWTPVRNFAGAMGLIWLQFVALTWMKAIIPAVTPMWADVPLANLEAALLGTDAWRLFPAGNRLIEVLYLAWAPAVCLSYVAVYFRRSERRESSLLALFLTVGLLGTFGQYLLPSGGPVFFERLGYGDRFAELEILFRTQFLTDRLWEAYEGRYIAYATGISAFPSIHVATTAWIALAFRHWLAYTYLAVIFVGSIVLGWHYAIDGIAGAVGAVFCYKLAGKILASKGRWLSGAPQEVALAQYAEPPPNQ